MSKISTYAVDTVGLIDFPDGGSGSGVILSGDHRAIGDAGRHWGARVVLLGVENVEELAERIADVISDTHDIDVTDDAYGVAVACELLGIDPDTVYAARRAEKARKEAEAAA